MIFEYKKSTTNNFLDGDATNFEIKIQKNGIIQYINFNFWGDIIKKKSYRLSDAGIAKIEKAIKFNRDIFKINSRLYNGSLDGCRNTFFFSNGKKNNQISALNIEDSIDNGNKIKKEYITKYGDNLKQERMVLKLFFEICEILKEEDFELNLYTFKTENKEC